MSGLQFDYVRIIIKRMLNLALTLLLTESLDDAET